jgi:hypothetical protein
MFTWLEKKNAPPDAGTVMARVIVLKYLFVKGLTTPPPEYLAECREKWTKGEWSKFTNEERARNAQLVERLHQNGLWNAMEHEERKFIEAGPAEVTQQALIDASWRVESIVCLLWALGYISELPPYDQQSNPDLTNRLPEEPATALIKKAALRPHGLVEKEREMAELWHWRSRTRQFQESGRKFAFPDHMTIEKVIQMASSRAFSEGAIPTPIGDDFPAFGKAYRDITHQELIQATSIAVERQRALNWLCGLAPGNRWSETPTDT